MGIFKRALIVGCFVCSSTMVGVGWFEWPKIKITVDANDLDEKLAKGIEKGADVGIEKLLTQIDSSLNENGKGSTILEKSVDTFLKKVWARVATDFEEENNNSSQSKARQALRNVGRSTSRTLFTSVADELETGSGARTFRILEKQGTSAVKKIGEEATGHVVQMEAYSKHYAQEIGKEVREATQSVFDDAETRVNNMAKMVDNLSTNMLNRLPLYGFILVLSSSSAYFGSKLVWGSIERYLKKPKLVIDSSYHQRFQRIWDFIVGKTEIATPMIFEPKLKDRLLLLSKATRRITQLIKEGKDSRYRNILLYGPPGTGKTMFAKRLARESGLQYVMLSGASFSKFKKGEGILAMDELFAWANKSNTGFIMFIDEADSFFVERELLKPGSDQYQIFNNFLNYTGERSDKFMIVFATNHIKNLDSALWRRIDDFIEMPLPKLLERSKVLQLYIKKILFNIDQNGLPFVKSAKAVLSRQKVEEIAQKTEGLSNGDLEGIVRIIKTDAEVLPSGLVTQELVDQVVERAIAKLHTLSTQTNKGIELASYYR